ncbi:MAG: dienelactone hydrolase family protein [Trueperaceae bacterium]
MNGPHEERIAATAGEPLGGAKAAVIMIHGRGDNAPGILGLASAIHVPGVAYVAPQATHNTWYPNSFMAPTESNQPWLDSALQTVGGVVDQVVEAGVPREKIVLLGFSQGACLASEYMARNATRYGGLAALSGGLIGPAGTPRDYQGSLDGTPVFLGCSDVDPHIPVERVHETDEVLLGLGGQVDKRIYPGFGHSVNQDEADAVRAMLQTVVDG